MRIQKKCGRKPRRNSEAYPWGSMKEVDDGATRSLRGEGPAKLTPTYGKTKWNRR